MKLRPRAENSEQLSDRIVELVYHTFLEGNDGIIRNRNVFWADLRAAFGDVTLADAV